jgi:predicted metal-dependent hydrolase
VKETLWGIKPHFCYSDQEPIRNIQLKPVLISYSGSGRTKDLVKINIEEKKGRWGSTSSPNNITLNSELMTFS